MQNWIHEEKESPKKNGTYLCLTKWFGTNDYSYEILMYEEEWYVSESCEDIYWMPLPEKDFEEKTIDFQDLFDFLFEELGVTALNDQMHEIRKIVLEKTEKNK